MKVLRIGATRLGQPPEMVVVGEGEVRVKDEFEEAFRRARENVRKEIERLRESEIVGPDIMNFVLC